MEKEIEQYKPVLISEEHPRLLTEEDILVRISISADDKEKLDWPDDIGDLWGRMAQEHKGYCKYREVRDDKDEADKHVVQHREDKLISPSNFLASDIRKTERGKRLAIFAGVLAGAVATGAVVSYIIVKRHKSK